MQTHKQLVARGHLRAVNAARLPTRRELVVNASAECVERLPPAQLAVVRAKEAVCVWLLGREAYGVSLNHAVKQLLLIAETADDDVGADVRLCEALSLAACGKKALPSRSTILDWLKEYREAGIAALASGHWQRARKTRGWEAKALEIYNVGGKPSAAAVARDLRRKHGYDCSVDQVRDYLKALPVHLAERSAERLGKHLFRQTETPYARRSTEDLLPGDIYMADGYRADVYLAHPMTGDIWRPEIMHVLDIKTNAFIGYRIMAHEGTYDVMLGWSEIFSRWQHVCVMVYVDRGSGYANRLATDEVTGYYRRSGVQRVIRSLPKNAKGKGNIERYHRVVRDDFLKTWQPQFYCGPDMAKDVLDETTRQIKAGHLVPPSLDAFIQAYNAWIADDYNQRPARDDKHLTRAEAFAGLVPIPPHVDAGAVVKPGKTCTVQRASVRLNNREYGHPDLIGWNKRKVLVEFDVLAHGMVTVRDQDGHLICDASLIKTIGVVGDSLIADARQQALNDSIKRLEKKIAEQQARAGRLIDADAIADGAALEVQATRLLPEDKNGDEINIFD